MERRAFFKRLTTGAAGGLVALAPQFPEATTLDDLPKVWMKFAHGGHYVRWTGWKGDAGSATLVSQWTAWPAAKRSHPRGVPPMSRAHTIPDSRRREGRPTPRSRQRSPGRYGQGNADATTVQSVQPRLPAGSGDDLMHDRSRLRNIHYAELHTDSRGDRRWRNAEIH